MSAIKRVLITRSPGSFLGLEKWCADHQIQLKSIPFIRIEGIPSLKIPQTDWIFFSSPKGATSYLNLYSIKANKIGVLGPGTERVLLEKGYAIDFCGDANDTPTTIGKKLDHITTASERILFPIGNRSKRSVINQLNPSNIIDKITYRTIEQAEQLSDIYDVILFTSPSNFSSYCSKNRLNKKSIHVAMGETTATAIQQHDASLQIITLKNPTEKAFITFLESQL